MILDETESYMEKNKEQILTDLRTENNFVKVAARHGIRWQKLAYWARHKWEFEAEWRQKHRVKGAIHAYQSIQPKVDKKEAGDFDMDKYIDLHIEKKRMMEKKSVAQEKVVIEIPPIYSLWVGQSDVHLFGDGTDMERFREDVFLIRDTPACYVFSMGDLLDNGGNITRLGRGRKNDDVAEMQHAAVDYYFDKIGDKIMALVVGNHDEWSYQSDGREYGEYWASKIAGGFLGFEGEAVIRIVDPDTKETLVEYRNWITHTVQGYSIYNPNHGGNRTLMQKNPYVDAVWWGHIHNTAVQKKWKADNEKVVFIRGGGYQMDARYAKSWSIQRAGIEIPGAILNPFNKSMVVDTDFTAMIDLLEGVNAIYSKKELTQVNISKEPVNKPEE